MAKQRTIRSVVEYSGIGLHTGNKSTARFLPAPINSGITFVRKDILGEPRILAEIGNVVGVIRGTTIGDGQAVVHTVEHICSALLGLQIDNVIVEINANEPPVADGSSSFFVETLMKAGFEEQDAPRKEWVCAQEYTYRNNTTEIRISPSENLVVHCKLLFDHPMIGTQENTFTITPESYVKEIARARTFCFDYEVEALKRKGLAVGGSLDNAVVVGIDRIYNQEKVLRYPDEFVRHKVLDFLGDLFLLGYFVRGRIDAIKIGHGHNINFVREIKEKFLKTMSKSKENFL